MLYKGMFGSSHIDACTYSIVYLVNFHKSFYSHNFLCLDTLQNIVLKLINCISIDIYITYHNIVYGQGSNTTWPLKIMNIVSIEEK